MSETSALLELCKTVARRAGETVDRVAREDLVRHRRTDDYPREIKATADLVLESEILAGLAPAGLPVLSEESELAPGADLTGWHFVVDPLDGTFNFVRGLGPSAISIGCWTGDQPVFGVVYSLDERMLYWGGPGIGAFADGAPLTVSTVAVRASAALCTGLPARLDLGTESAMRGFWDGATGYSKVRMFGSAAMSLVRVAAGAADAYVERNIMLWDVAAGLAIVQGAGGRTRCTPGTITHSRNVFASNAILFDEGVQAL